MANILILRDVNTGDKDIKTGVAEVEKYNNDFKENIDSIYTSTEVIEKFVHEINTADLSKLAQDLTAEREVEQEDIISSKDLEISYIENTLVISEEQKKVILPYTINQLKETLLKNNTEYSSLQDVIDKVYTKPINYYRFSAIARFKETYKLVREKEKGPRA